jgi:3-phosphoshikimate 1-carboxyvinyltransferase
LKIGIVKPIRGGIIGATASIALIQRALMCAALSDSGTFIKCNERPDEITATINSLKAQGAKIRYDGMGYQIDPIKLPEAGRGFAAAAAMHGYAGQNNRGEYWLPGNVAYQTINGLLFTIPIQSGMSKITVEGRMEYKPYIDMTLDTLEQFGIKVEQEIRNDGGMVYKIAGGQTYITTETIEVDGDWTNSAFWLCAAAIGGEGVICNDLNRYSRQGDRDVVNILERFGAATSYKGDSVAIRRARLRSIRIDAAQTPDIIPALAVVASVTEGRTVIYNAGRVGLHENGMLKKINDTLTILGADIIMNSDGLIIQGKKRLQGGTVSSFGDPRIVMMTAIAAGVCEDTVAINDADAVSKVYPDFFDDYEKLGGITRRF